MLLMQLIRNDWYTCIEDVCDRMLCSFFTLIERECSCVGEPVHTTSGPRKQARKIILFGPQRYSDVNTTVFY
jgi:hypothetical protein